MSEKFKCQIFIDPLYGGERYIEFNPEWVALAEDRMQKLVLRPKIPATFIKFRKGQTYLVMGHWAEKIVAAQAELEGK